MDDTISVLENKIKLLNINYKTIVFRNIILSSYLIHINIKNVYHNYKANIYLKIHTHANVHQTLADYLTPTNSEMNRLRVLIVDILERYSRYCVDLN